MTVAPRAILITAGACLAFLALISNGVAATPVDLYQSMGSGNDGDLLTPDIMNVSTYGSSSSWAITNSLWVSNLYARDMPGSVSVSGTVYPGAGSTRTWRASDTYQSNFVTCNFSGTSGNFTLACYYTSLLAVNVWNNFDTILIRNPSGKGVVMQTIDHDGNGPYLRAHGSDVNRVTTYSPTIKIVRGKTYWINLNYNSITGLASLAAFDPDNNFAQVGNTVTCDATAGLVFGGVISFGRTDAHGDNPTATTSSYFQHLLVDYTNGAFPLIPNENDATPPSAPPAVRDGTSTDIDVSYLLTQLSANWDAAADAESGIVGYQDAIGTTPGGTNVVCWTSTANVNAITVTGLTLTVGQTYYFSVKAVNCAGLVSDAVSSDGVLVVPDGTPPSAPAAVRDGTSTDIDVSYSLTQLSANWDAAADAESGIADYQYAIGTTAGGSDVVDWTSVGNVLAVTKSLLTLTAGQKYYFSVRAVNGVGLIGAVGTSNGQTAQPPEPVVYFQDNFESWTARPGAWTSATGTSTTLNVSTDQAKAGTHGLKVTLPSAGYLQKTFNPIITGDVYVRFYVYLPTGWIAANGVTVRLLSIYDGNWDRIGQMTLMSGKPVMQETKNYSSSSYASALSEGAWHCIEMHQAPPSPTTLLEFWVDGMKVSKTLTANFSAGTGCNYIQFGDISGGNSGSFYLDEIVVSNTYIGPIAPPPQIVAFMVQKGRTGRSFVRYVDVTFDQSSGIADLIANKRVKLTRYDLDGQGSGVAVNLAGVATANGSQLSLDFGAKGLGGIPNTTAADGYYDLALDLDRDGEYETHRHFYRLLGDVNGDRIVATTDANLILADYRRQGADLNTDVNGDGLVNALDRTLAIRSLNRKLADGLTIDN